MATNLVRSPSIKSSVLSRSFGEQFSPAIWERGQGRRRRSSQTLDAAPRSPSLIAGRSVELFSRLRPEQIPFGSS